ncbi:MAG: glycoside hydrolase family 3 N-terminal domain-containing protein [Frisingicoccus sp.]
MKKVSIGRYIFGIFTAIIAVLAGFIVSLVFWVLRTWANLKADELIYQLNAPMQGTNKEMIMDAVKSCVPVMILCLAAVIVLFVLLRNKKIFWIVMPAVIIISLAAGAGVLNHAWNKLEVSEYLENKDKDTGFIDGNYISPSSVQLQFPEEKRNLIYIFLESMEVTYSDKENGGAFDVNYIPELTALAQEYEDFSGSDSALNGGYDMPSTTWTAAALFAQSSGLPLSISIEGNSMNTQDEFMPNVVMIGDILEDAGYNQMFLIGSNATFGGRRLMYSDHGNFTIHDWVYAGDSGRLPKGYFEWWGYRDSLLFEYAKEELQELASGDEPFNLTMLTVDTHFEDGFVCDLCGDEFGDNRYGNVIACSSRQVTEFVRWIQQQDFYENTTIVISGDHHTMDVDFCEDIDEDYVRRVYTAVINPAAEVADASVRRDFTTFDMFPTTLASIGVQIQGNRLGLGTNLFSDEPTLLETYGMDEMKVGVSSKSELMDYFTAEVDEEKFKEATEPKQEEGPKAWYEEKLESMTLEEKVAQMFIVSPEDVSGTWLMTEADETLRESLERYPVGGLIYDSDNIENQEQLSALIEGSQQYMQDRMGMPLLQCIVEDGGESSILAASAGVNVPQTANVSDALTVEQAEQNGRTIGKYLSELGFNLNLAPNVSIGSEQVQSELDGFHWYGVFGAPKYFPGYGETDGNIEVERTVDDLLGNELYPFDQASREGNEFIMVGHISVPGITGDYTPASLSGQMVYETLRRLLGYNGVIVTDALDQDEIIYNYGTRYASIMAIQAGCDMLLSPYDFQSAYYGVLNAVYDGTISEERIDESVRRILKAKQELILWETLSEQFKN